MNKKFLITFSLIRVGRNLDWRTPERQTWTGFHEAYKKEARESTLAYPATEALASPITKDKQCDAHAMV